MGKYKVQLEPGVWLADAEGDPGRTLEEGNAQKFLSLLDALEALDEARKHRPFESATIDSDFF